MTDFRLPDLGEGLQEAEIVAWHVGVGDRVVADQPLVSVETDKAVVEVPAPHGGRIKALHGAPGEMVPVGAVLVEFEEEERADAGTVVGRMPGAAPAAEARPAEARSGAAPPRTAAAGGGGPGVKATPAVRALAQRLGVDLAAVAGSGPEGRVTREDVERAAHAPAAAEPEAAGAIPLRGVRRAMAVNMARAHAAVVPATLTDEADVDHWPPGTDVTARLVRAIVAGCRAAPALNCWFDAARMIRILHERIDLGIAMETEDGLFVPVLRDVAGRDAADLRRGLEAMKADMAARRVPPEELRGQTISLSNFGMLAGRFAQLVVMPPQVAILGAGRIAPRIVARDGKPALRRILPLSLTFDHRAVTGAEAARFLAAVMADLGAD